MIVCPNCKVTLEIDHAPTNDKTEEEIYMDVINKICQDAWKRVIDGETI